MADRTCAGCDIRLPPPRRKWCSDRCRVKAWQRGFRERTGEYQSTRYRRAHGRLPERFRSITCAWCQQPAQVRNRRARYCSNECGQAARYAVGKQLVLAQPGTRIRSVRWRDAEERLNAAAAGSRSRNAVWAAGCCRRCGESFLCMVTNAPPVYCSRSCSRSDSKARRRARTTCVTPVSRAAIFERDRWTCKLCGKRVKRTAAVPDPKAPVLDHIVPLAAGPESGGVHAPWNVQCTHFLCNSIKSATYRQGALF